MKRLQPVHKVMEQKEMSAPPHQLVAAIGLRNEEGARNLSQCIVGMFLATDSLCTACVQEDSWVAASRQY